MPGLLLAAAGTTSAVAFAKPVDVSGFEAGLRLGIEVPAGDIDSGSSFRGAALRGVAPFRIPVWLDAGYRLSAPWWLGIGAQVGTGPFGDACPEASQCDWTDVRLYAQLHYQFRRQETLVPWLGAALGWESLRGSITQTVEVDVRGEPTEVAAKLKEVRGGPQLMLQGGIQFLVDDGLRVGPYATAAAGAFLTGSFECPSGLGCGDLEGGDSRLHAWFGLGVRASYGP